MTHHKHTQIVSRTPGRTRIKLSPKRRNAQEISRIASALRQRPLVNEVCTNLRTGSIVLQHEHGGFEDIKATMKDLGVIFAKATDVDIPGEDDEAGGGLSFAGAIEDLNRRLGLPASGVVNLRVLVPMGFGVLSAVQLMRRGLELQGAPWYVLAFAALESFFRLNYPNRPEASEEDQISNQS